MANEEQVGEFNSISDFFAQDVDALNYVYNTFSQVLMDNNLKFKFITGYGHAEFYAFGPDKMALPLYDATTGERLELLTISRMMSMSRMKFAVTEMINMIRRKRLGPVGRRIKE